MVTATPRVERRWTPLRVLVVGTLGGMLAGMMMALAEMLYGAFSSTRSFWDSPMAIWAWVFGEEHFTQNMPGEHVWPVILGIGAHMTNSMLVGIVFAALMAALRLRDDIAPILIGVAYALGLWALMRYVILPLNAGEGDLFTTATVSPQWLWWVAHAGLGMTAGLVYDVARRLVTTPAYEGFEPQVRPAA